MSTCFDYLENVAFAATVCNRDGVVLYQNSRAIKRDGSVVGKSLYDCHNAHSAQMIRQMIETGQSNTYEIIRHGKRRLLQQTPWYETPGGIVAGLVELSVDLPDSYPTFNRDDSAPAVKPVCGHNPAIDCPCPKECPRHGKCCQCIAQHRSNGKLPHCLR